jgi:hypothetical protein
MSAKHALKFGWFGAGLLAAGLCSASAHAALTPYRNLILADGATAYYEFEEAPGSVTSVDSAGGDNNGTNLNVTLGQPSKNAVLGKAASFAGNGAVRIPDGPVFDRGNGPATVEFWYFTNNAARGDFFTYKGGGGDFGVHSNSEAVPPGFTAGVSVFFNGFTSPAAAGSTLGAWHHVAVTRDAVGNVGTYVDGILLALGTKTDTLNITNDILIGSNHNGDPASLAIPYTGLIDEVAWYPVALTQAQLQSHIGASVPEPSTVGVVLTVGAALATRRRRR